MARILFLVYPNMGSLIASMKLAADLKANGHTVSYMGLKDSEDYISSHGFEFLPVFQKHFPKAYLLEQTKLETTPIGIKYFRMLRKRVTGFKVFLDDLISDGGEEFLGLLKGLRPDLIIYASGSLDLEWIAILASSLGMKGIYFSDVLIPCENLGFPPPTSNLIPTNSLWTRIRVYIAWTKYKSIAAMINSWSLMLGFNWNNPSKILAMKYGYRWNIHNTAYKRERILRLPELISFPAVFDFPGAEIPGSYYIGASIFLERNQPSFPWDNLNGNRPLIYCALGSELPHGDRKKCIDFFRTIIDSSNIRPNWQWVLAVGNNLKVEDFGLMPDNVLVVSHAPQLELLKRATMMITHGGANTVKECIYFGVPMIIITSMTTPLALSDIPVYTARVVYHGLGVEADLRKLNVTYLRNLIDTVDRDPYFRSQVKIMQAKFREIEEENLGVKLVEIILGLREVVWVKKGL